MANKRIESGISIRESQVKKWLTKHGFKGDCLLVSTKLDSIYSKKLAELQPGRKLIVDLYTPIFLEKELTLSKWKPQDLLTRWRNKQMVRKFMTRGNHFLVANRRQREYWLKTAKNLGIPLKENDISVLPTGAGYEPLATSQEPRAGQPKVVLWFGGIYPWMDPWPLVEAFGRLAPKFPSWRLRFLGGWHPRTGYRGIYRKLEEFGREKIPKSQLEFIPWQLERDLSKYFKDAAFAVHLVKQTSEDFYAHRVRLLTLFSAGIPILTSGRDVISDLAVKLGAAARTKPGRDSVEKNLISPFSFLDQLNKMRKCCLRVERILLQQETDIRLNDSNHLTFV